MIARIEEIRIQNFRALENVRLKLHDLTFLVGRNGAGKSSVLDAIEFIREAVTDSLPNALNRRDGFRGVYRKHVGNDAMPLALAVMMRAEISDRTVRMLYGFRLTPRGGDLGLDEQLRVAPKASLGFTRTDDEFLSDVLPRPPVLAKNRLALPLVASEQLWKIALETLSQMRAYEISPPAIAVPAPIQNTTNLDRSGSNAGDVLEDVRQRPAEYAELSGALASIVAGDVQVTSSISLGRRILSFHQNIGGVKTELNATQMSQGTLRALGMLLALYQQPQPSLVLIDEVEDSIHPHALEAILEAASGFSELFPVVLTTHSPEVLSTKQASAERLRVVQWKDGVSSLYPLSEGTTKSIDGVTSVGDLLRINALWPRDAPDRVEGDIWGEFSK